MEKSDVQLMIQFIDMSLSRGAVRGEEIAVVASLRLRLASELQDNPQLNLDDTKPAKK